MKLVGSLLSLLFASNLIASSVDVRFAGACAGGDFDAQGQGTFLANSSTLSNYFIIAGYGMARQDKLVLYILVLLNVYWLCMIFATSIIVSLTKQINSISNSKSL